ncbi:MAG: hypothetical protein Q9168_007771 [Polycauliona sp. 1 TL-2023]
MPRTVFDPGPRFTSDPDFLRGWVEEDHFEILRRIFALPPSLSSPKQTSSSNKEDQLSRILSFRRYNSVQGSGNHLSKLQPPDVRMFCWKDCAVYGLHTGLPGQRAMKSLTLLERGYRAWFPRRSTDRDVSDGSFWGILVWFRIRKEMVEEKKTCGDDVRVDETKQEAIGSLAQVWSFHEVFCEYLKILAGGIEDSEAGKWDIRASFTEMVMIIEAEWEEKGVRLTWKNDPGACYVGFATEELRIVETEVQGGFWEMRCPLERAIRIVASRDPERRGGRREEWSHQFEGTLVDDDDAGRTENQSLVVFWPSSKV